MARLASSILLEAPRRPEPAAHSPDWRSAENLRDVRRQKFKVASRSVNGGYSSERGEFGRSGSADTDLSVPNRLVGHGELGEVVADHVRLDLNRVPVLATIALNDAIAHFRNDDSVTQMGLDTLRLLSKRDILLGEAELLNEAIVLGRVAAFEASALS